VRIAVYGLWHLGLVVAAGLAGRGRDVIAIDEPERVRELRAGKLPVAEPGLTEALEEAVAAGRLDFDADPALAGACDVLWLCLDTPVDEDDVADVEWVRLRATAVAAHVRPGGAVLVSSQVPVGFTRALSAAAAPDVEFGYSPENLRLGKALESFHGQARTIVGTAGLRGRARLAPLVEPLAPRTIWTSLESAEMAKHALNAFLATSVTFANEIARICERNGADAREVEAALRSEPRIGPGAYLRPGAAFDGGTLARDVAYLTAMATDTGVSAPLLDGVLPSNAEQRLWALRQLERRMIKLDGKRVAILGLTYKRGVDTLRRSPGVFLYRKLVAAGARPVAADPLVRALPDDLSDVAVFADPARAIEDADAAVVAADWPELAELSVETALARMRRPLLLDPDRRLATAFGADSRVEYVTIGAPG
jgi:UDPglucose 6-dehydrogenase